MTDEERAGRLECQLISALHHIRQLLQGELTASEVAWWVRANHQDHMNDYLNEDQKALINELADKAEKSTG
jgi:hypothetical protein